MSMRKRRSLLARCAVLCLAVSLMVEVTENSPQHAEGHRQQSRAACSGTGLTQSKCLPAAFQTNIGMHLRNSGSRQCTLSSLRILRKMQPCAWLGGIQAMHRPKPRHLTGTRAMPGDTPPAIFRGNASLPQSGSIAGPGGEDALVPSSTARRARNKVPEGAPSTPSAGIALY